jgi:DNA-binding NarL/FixJ family response regulator
MEIVGSLVDLVERAYDVDPPSSSWLEGIRLGADKCFGGHLAVQAYTFQVYGNGAFRILDLASAPAWAGALRANHAAASPALIKRLYLGKPVSNLRSALRPDDGPLYDQIVRLGVGDALGVTGVDPTGFGCTLHFLSQTPFSLSRAAQRGLTRIAAHLASARRLRETLDHAGARLDAVEGADAVLSADGRVQHAERDARSAESRAALREAVRRMERARRRSIRADSETALGLWRAMVDGRWSLLERFESGGRRILVARRNDPASRPSHALSELERKVVALLAVGHSQKLCAYELGRAESTIHDVAASAMTKMGVGSRAALVELHGALVSDEAPGWSPGPRAAAPPIPAR